MQTQLPIQYIQCKASTIQSDVEGNKSERIIKIVASDETPIQRFSWENWESYNLVLSHDKNHVNLDRIGTGVCLFFNNHPDGSGNSQRIGKVINYEIANNQLILEIRLGTSPEAERYLRDLGDGVEPGNSVGISVEEITVIKKAEYEILKGEKVVKKPMLAKATNWSLLEVSAVDVPANPNTGKYVKNSQELMYSVTVIGADVGDKIEQSTTQSDEKLSQENLKLTLSNEFLKLRYRVLELFAVDNKLTEKEFEFFGTLQQDLDIFVKLSNEDQKVELKVLERVIRTSEKNSPESRLSSRDVVLMGNSQVSVKPEDGVVSQTNRSPQTPTGESVDSFSERIVKRLF